MQVGVGGGWGGGDGDGGNNDVVKCCHLKSNVKNRNNNITVNNAWNFGYERKLEKFIVFRFIFFVFCGKRNVKSANHDEQSR